MPRRRTRVVGPRRDVNPSPVRGLGVLPGRASRRKAVENVCMWRVVRTSPLACCVFAGCAEGSPERSPGRVWLRSRRSARNSRAYGRHLELRSRPRARQARRRARRRRPASSASNVRAPRSTRRPFRFRGRHRDARGEDRLRHLLLSPGRAMWRPRPSCRRTSQQRGSRMSSRGARAPRALTAPATRGRHAARTAYPRLRGPQPGRGLAKATSCSHASLTKRDYVSALSSPSSSEKTARSQRSPLISS